MFLHYLPTSIPEDERLFTAMAEEYGAEQVVYAHSRGESRFHDRIPGEKTGFDTALLPEIILKATPHNPPSASPGKFVL